jgi:hypothetical protein
MMSLVGNLEDLSLGDILQIISLSQKSGVLALTTTGSAGRILFLDGKVRGAALKEGPQDLRGILSEGGFISGSAFDAASEEATRDGLSLRTVIAAQSDLTEERIDSLCRETIEAAVVRMFSWTRGDFSFDVRGDPEPGDPEALVDSGINAQYLAMEGARISDEEDASSVAGAEAAPADVMSADALMLDDEAPVDDADAAFDGMSAHEMFGVSAEEPVAGADTPGSPTPEAVEHLAMATLQRVQGEGGPELGGEIADISDQIFEAEAAPSAAALEPEPLDLSGDSLIDILDAEAVALPVDSIEGDSDAGLEWIELEEDAVSPVPNVERAGAQPIEPSVVEASASGPDASAVEGASNTQADRTLIVLDSSLPALEWVKDSLAESFARVHIFQHTQQALSRIRQYLVRSEPPIVLISPDIEVDRMAGIKDPGDFVVRLKAQSPRLVAIWLREQGNDLQARLGPADGSVTRPERKQLRRSEEPEAKHETQLAFARQLHVELDGALSEVSAATPFVERRRDISPNTLRQLRDATRALTEASSRGEVLPLVIRFASEIFGRVAMFMVREGHVVGMAQSGLAEHGGPDDAALRSIQLEASESDWLSAVLESGKPIQCAPTNEGDHALARALGDSIPAEAYVAPIESTGQVIALLYADNLPGGEAITDTSALEVVLHHAGLALDRAALERALHEDSGGNHSG